jgi:hypothetical protein
VDRSKATEDEQKGVCQQLDKQGTRAFVLEPQCLAWSPNDDGFIDMLAWTPLLAFPPVNLDPYVAWFLPWCYKPSGTSCDLCELNSGVEAKRITTLSGIFQTTLQFNGFAVSWADEGLLQIGANSGDNLQI